MGNFTLHDMGHTGQTLAAATGAKLKDLMRRLGNQCQDVAGCRLTAVLK